MLLPPVDEILEVTRQTFYIIEGKITEKFNVFTKTIENYFI